MFKQIVSVALLAVVLQGTAFAADSSGQKRPFIENRLDVVKAGLSESRNPSDYESPEVFANFREITTTGMKPKTVYRSSNPVDIKSNKVRHSYADKLARQAGIRAEIDLADDDSKLQEFFKSSAARKKYCYGLYKEGKLFNRHLHGNGLQARDWPLMAEAFRFMLQNEGPYLVHCRLGRDRAGIFSMLCSALAGATVNDLRKDYMQTYCNYYHIKPQSYEYEQIKKFQADPVIYYIAHPEYASDKRPMPKKINVNGIKPEEAAINFFKTALKFSDEEIAALQAKLKSSEKAEMFPVIQFRRRA